MPSASKKQHNMMAMVADNPKAAKRLGISQDIGKDFNEADKSKSFSKGGIPASINKQKTHHVNGGVPNYSLNKFAGLKRGGMAESKEMVKKEISFMKGKGAPKSMVKHEEKEMKAKKFAAGGVTKAKSTPTGKQMGMLGMKSGGMPMVMKDGKKMPAFAAKGASAKRPMMEAPMMKKGGMTKMSKGGGIESKGKTKGRMC